MESALTPTEFSLVQQGFSLVIAAMGAAFVFFLGARSQVGAKYRPALLISAVVVGVACYHYVRIFDSWGAAYIFSNGMYMANPDYAFNDAYRYADWLVTVPLLLLEVIAVLALARNVQSKMFAKLTVASVLMLVLGYPGEVTTDMGARAFWGGVSSIPFWYILYVLWVELGESIKKQPERVQGLIKGLRLLLLASWGFYPIAYALPVLGVDGTAATVGVQLGYTVADILAKPVYGLFIYAIAKAKTEADEAAQSPSDSPTLRAA